MVAIKYRKLVAVALIILMTMSDFLLIGNSLASYAIDIVKANNTNIEFSAYFINQQGEKVDSINEQIDKKDLKMYIEAEVMNEGYFNGKISFENNNFNIKQEQSKENEYIKEIKENQIFLNQINAGNKVILEVDIEPIIKDKVTIYNLNGETTVLIEGDYINSNNIEKERNTEIIEESKINLNWISSEDIDSILEATLINNYIYQEKRVMQILVNSQIINNSYPIKENEITISVPEKAEKVSAYARKTDGTNKEIIFDKENYTYNEEEKKISIKLLNQDKENIYWEKQTSDEIVITCIYKAEENLKEESIEVNNKINTYDGKELLKSTNVDITNEIRNVISSSINATEKQIYKGKIYTGNERTYEVISQVNVDYAEVLENIIIDEENSTYTINEDEKVANSIYKSISIKKQEFINLLGKNGYITIKQNDNIIANINNNTETNEDGNIIIELNGEITALRIETSQPIQQGTLRIHNVKAIKNNKYTREEVEKITSINEKIIVNNEASEEKIELLETKSEIKLSTDVDVISTLEDKQTVTIGATLMSNDESKDLYKNPKLEIVLPNEIEIISAKCALLYKNGLEIQNTMYKKDEDGAYRIYIELVGEQLEYDAIGGTEIYVKLEIKPDILTPSKKAEIKMIYTNENKNYVNEAISDIKFASKYGVMLYNEMLDINLQGDNIKTTDEQKANGKIDMLSNEKEIIEHTAIINNYETTIENVSIIGEMPSQEKSDTYKAKINKILLNKNDARIYYSKDNNDNWTEDITNAVKYKIEIDSIDPQEIIAVSLSETIPENLGYNEKGSFETKVNYTINEINQETISLINLGTEQKDNTFDTTEGGAKYRLSNGLEANIRTIAGDQELNDGESIYEGQVVKYKIKLTNTTENDMQNIDISAVQHNGNVWKVVEEIGYNYVIHDYEPYYWYKESNENSINFDTIKNIKSGETKELEIEATTKKISECVGEELYNDITINIDSNEYNISTIKNKIIQANLAISITDNIESKEDYIYRDRLSAKVEIKNLLEEDINNAIVKIVLPSELEYDEDEFKFLVSEKLIEETQNGLKEDYTILVDKNEKDEVILTLKIDKILKEDVLYFYLNSIISEFIGKREINILATIEDGNGKIYQSNLFSKFVSGKKNIIIESESFSDGSKIEKDTIVSVDKEITTKYKITNKDNEENKLYIYTNFPRGTDQVKCYIYNNNSKIDISEKIIENSFSYEFTINSQETIEFEFIIKLDFEEMPNDEYEYTVYIKEEENLEDFDIETIIKTNASTYSSDEPEEDIDTEEPDEYPEDTDPDNPNEDEENTEKDEDSKDDESENENTENNNQDEKEQEEENLKEENEKNNYTLSGKAWLDENENGKRDSNEKGIENIKILAIDVKTGNKIEKEVTTKTNGEYSITLPEGKYIILFLYNDNEYFITTYQASGIENTINCDAIRKEWNLNNKNTIVGATDEIDLSEKIENIDIGLVTRKKFDFKVEKYISKVTVSNDEGIKTTQMKDTQLAKVEIDAKHIRDSLVAIEYTIKVTNTGEIAGFVGNVIDKIPAGLTFTSNMNKDWYLNENKLYNTSLANTKIEANETKEIKIILIKAMSENNTGLINNEAEITNLTNEKGPLDNNLANNKSSANIIISIKTGKAIKYMLMILLIIIIEAGGMYLITKKVLIEGGE